MSESNSFSICYQVRFKHCDPAGIVFYPRYFEMLSAAVEDYFERIVGVTHAQICKEGKGIPLVSINLNFLKPSFLGDSLKFKLMPEKVGKTSIKFGIEVALETLDEQRVVGDFVLVYMDLKKQTSEVLPAYILNALKKDN